MRRAVLLTLVAAVSACTPDRSPPAIEAQIVRVNTPVAVPCIAAADVPSMPRKVGDQLTGNAASDAAVLAASVLELRAALSRSLALISSCTTAIGGPGQSGGPK